MRDPALLDFFNESFFTLPPQAKPPICQTRKSIASTLQDFANVLQTTFPSLKREHINNLRLLDFETSPHDVWPTNPDKKKFSDITIPDTIPTIIALLQSGSIPITQSEPEIQDLLTKSLAPNVCYAGKLINIENVAKKLNAYSSLENKFMMVREQTIRDLVMKQLPDNRAMEIHQVSEILYAHQALWGIEATHDPRSEINPTIRQTLEIAEKTKIKVRSLLPSGVLFNLTQDIGQSQPDLIFDLLTAAYGSDDYYADARALLDHLYYYDEHQMPVWSWAAEHYLFLSIYYRLIAKGYCKKLYRTDELASGMTITYLPASANIDNSLAFCHITTADNQRTPLIVYAIDALFENNNEAIASIDLFLQKNKYPIRNFSQLLKEKESELIAAFSQIQNDFNKDCSKINYTLLDEIIPEKQNEFWKIFLKKASDLEIDPAQMILVLLRIPYNNLKEMILSKNNFKNAFFEAILELSKNRLELLTYPLTYVENCIANAQPGVVYSIISTVKNKNTTILEEIFEKNLLQTQQKKEPNERLIQMLKEHGVHPPAINPEKIDGIGKLKKAKLFFIHGTPVDINDTKTMQYVHWMHICNDTEITLDLSEIEHESFFAHYLSLFENALKQENHAQIHIFLQDEEIVANMLSNENLLKQARVYFKKESACEDSLICLVETMITSPYAAYTTQQREEYTKLIKNITPSNKLQEKILQYANEISDDHLTELTHEVIPRIENDERSLILCKFATGILTHKLKSETSCKLLDVLFSHTKDKALCSKIKIKMKKCATSKTALDLCYSLFKKYDLRQKDKILQLLNFNPAIIFLAKKQSISYYKIHESQVFFENYSLSNSDFKSIEFICAHGGLHSFSSNVILKSEVFKNFLNYIKKKSNSILISNLDLESIREEVLKCTYTLSLALQHKKISPPSNEEILSIFENRNISEPNIPGLMKQIDKKKFHIFFYKEIIELDTLSWGRERMAKYIDIDTFTLSDRNETILEYAVESKNIGLAKRLFKLIPKFKVDMKNFSLMNEIFNTTPKNELSEFFNRSYASLIFEALKTNPNNTFEEYMDHLDQSEPKFQACSKTLEIIYRYRDEGYDTNIAMFAKYCNDKFSKYQNQIEKTCAPQNRHFIQALMSDALSRKMQENVLKLFSSYYFDEHLFKPIYTKHKVYIRLLIPFHDRVVARGNMLIHAYADDDYDTIDRLLKNSKITDQRSFNTIKEQLNIVKKFTCEVPHSPKLLYAFAYNDYDTISRVLKSSEITHQQSFDTIKKQLKILKERKRATPQMVFKEILKIAMKTKDIKIIHQMITQMMNMGMIIFLDSFDDHALVAVLEHSITIVENFKIIKDFNQYHDSFRHAGRSIQIAGREYSTKELIKIAAEVHAKKTLEILIGPLRNDDIKDERGIFSAQEWCNLKLLLPNPADAKMLRPLELSTIEKNLEEYITKREKEWDNWLTHWRFNICGAVYYFGHSKAVKMEAANWLLTILAGKPPTNLSPEATEALQQKNSRLGNLYRDQIRHKMWYDSGFYDHLRTINPSLRPCLRTMR